jgi:uncharacterized membrane protein YdjX (TVP38/TMEM64 family)
MSTKRRQILIRGAILVSFIVLIFYFSRHAPQPFHFLEFLPDDDEEISSRQEKLIKFLLSFGPYSSAVFVLLQSLQVVISPIPGDIAGMVGGYVYGKAFGFLLSIIGVALGSWIAFELARILGRPFTQRFVKREILEKFDFVTTEMGVTVCFLLFLLPYFPKDSLCYALGLSRMGLSTFLIVSTVGRMPGIYMQVVVGASIQNQEYAQTIAIVVIFAVILLVAYLYRHPLHQWIKGRSGKNHHK